ncbi:NAD-dependent epimerase/dehydratase family protein [Parasediminibacterium sp. JCM 36343]|uniref:NAD-dependent epimerase/dehydratase family protein n=1 Tax=Parasediminibacterium sp. JCM 36343 TaxID=3374279 RepID=UPI00397E2B58
MVLVTGASGLVGSHLISYLLLQGKKVRALHRGEPPVLAHPNLEWFRGDILDVIDLEEAMQGIAQVYHCAATVSFSPKEKKQLFQVNVDGTANVVNACLNTGIEKLLYISSVAALGRFGEKELINETMSWTEAKGNSLYGKTKYLAEMEVWRGIGEGLDAVIINPTIILGAGDWDKGSSAIFKSAYNQFPWFTDGSTGFVDVQDLAKAMVLLMDSNITAQRFIINGANMPYKDLFSSIATFFGKKPPHKTVTKTMVAIVWRLEAVKAAFTGKKPLLTKETAHTAQAKVKFDNSKLLAYLPGFAYTPIQATLERVCRELKEKYNL